MFQRIGLDNYPIIQIKNEKATENNKEEKVPLPVGGIEGNRDFFKSRIDSLFHNIQPTLGHGDLEHGRHRLSNVIEVGVTLNPIAAVIHAVLHCVDVGPKVLWDVAVIADVEASFEVVYPENPEQEEDQKAEEEKINHIRERFSKRVNSNCQPLRPRDNS